MILFYEKGIREGITRATFKYAQPNNKLMYEYDKTKKYIYIFILIVTICSDILYHNHFLVQDLNLLKIYQCSHLRLSWIMKKNAILAIH